MIGGTWRWIWTASVFGVFALVIAAALDDAPGRDGLLPVIAAGSEPLKEQRALAPIDEVVPDSSVLNLLAESDAPARDADAARSALEREIARTSARAQEVLALETALQPITPGEPHGEADGGSAVAAVPAGGAFRIQIAAVRPGEEHDTFARLQTRYGQILGDLSPRFQVFSADGGVLVRVQAGPIGQERDAMARCERLVAAGGECFVVQAPG